jgi:hypothetical protein
MPKPAADGLNMAALKLGGELGEEGEWSEQK